MVGLFKDDWRLAAVMSRRQTDLKIFLWVISGGLPVWRAGRDVVAQAWNSDHRREKHEELARGSRGTLVSRPLDGSGRTFGGRYLCCRDKVGQIISYEGQSIFPAVRSSPFLPPLDRQLVIQV